MRGYKRNEGRPKCALKLDVINAYDSVTWELLCNTRQAMDFPDLFLQWGSTPRYSVIINWELQGCLHGERGLGQGQGNVISPYLLVAPYSNGSFFSTFQANIGYVGFTYHSRCAELQIYHLIYPHLLMTRLSSAVMNPNILPHSWCFARLPLYLGLKHNLQKRFVFIYADNQV